MPRIPRIIDPEGVYHVITRGNNKACIFDGHDFYSAYLKILRRAKRRFGFELFHYVLMPNHVHLLLRPRTSLPDTMHYICLEYSKWFRWRTGFVGHVWQGRYKAYPVDSDGYLLSCGNYIEMNPVRAKIVSRPEGWAYSSFGYYGCGKKDMLVDPDPLFHDFGKSPVVRHAAYRNFVDKTRQ